MEEDVKGMRGEIGEINPAEFLQTEDQILGRLGARYGKKICCKFMASGKNIEKDGDKEVYRGEEEAEEDQAGINRHIDHTKGLKDTLIIKGERENIEENAGMQDGGHDHFGYMVEFEVAHLMSQDSYNLSIREFFHQGVIEDDFSKTAKACEKRIQFSRAFRSVHGEYPLHLECLPFGIRHDSLFQGAVRQRCEGVEEGHDKNGGQVLEDNCDKHNTCPAIEPGQRAQAFKKPENHGQDGTTYNNGQQKALE